MRIVSVSPDNVGEKCLSCRNIILDGYRDYLFKGIDLSYSKIINQDISIMIDLRGVVDLNGFDLCGINTTKSSFLYDDKILDADVSKIRADFLSKMLFEGDAIFDLKYKMQNGLIDGGDYGIGKKCGCFVGSIANFRKYECEDDVKFVVNSESPIELWFRGIKPGDTPKNNLIVKITMGWVNDFIAAMQSLTQKVNNQCIQPTQNNVQFAMLAF